MKTLVTTFLALALVTGFRPPEVRAGGAVGSAAPEFQLENVLDTAPDTFSLQEHRGSVVVIAFFTYY